MVPGVHYQALLDVDGPTSNSDYDLILKPNAATHGFLLQKGEPRASLPNGVQYVSLGPTDDIGAPTQDGAVIYHELHATKPVARIWGTDDRAVWVGQILPKSAWSIVRRNDMLERDGIGIERRDLLKNGLVHRIMFAVGRVYISPSDEVMHLRPAPMLTPGTTGIQLQRQTEVRIGADRVTIHAPRLGNKQVEVVRRYWASWLISTVHRLLVLCLCLCLLGLGGWLFGGAMGRRQRRLERRHATDP